MLQRSVVKLQLLIKDSCESSLDVDCQTFIPEFWQKINNWPTCLSVFYISADSAIENRSIFTTNLSEQLTVKLTLTTDYAIEQMDIMLIGLTRSSKHTIFSSKKPFNTFFCSKLKMIWFFQKGTSTLNKISRERLGNKFDRL